MSPSPFTYEELPIGTRVYVKHEGYGVVIDHEPATDSLGVRCDSDGEVVSAGRLQVQTKVVDLQEEDA